MTLLPRDSSNKFHCDEIICDKVNIVKKKIYVITCNIFFVTYLTQLMSHHLESRVPSTIKQYFKQ